MTPNIMYFTSFVPMYGILVTGRYFVNYHGGDPVKYELSIDAVASDRVV